MNAPTGKALEDARAKAQADHRALRSRIDHLSADAIDLILRDARSHYAWTDRPIADDVLQEMYDITINGPTSMNTLPARFVFVKSAEGKARLAKSLKPQNVAKMMGAPVTVIIAYDMDFWKELPFLFPHEDRRHLFDGKPEYCADTAYRNGTLQGAYLMIAARALGLDVGAMSGFSNAIVDEEFFKGTTLKSNFLCNIGYADETALFQKLPRFTFDQVCTVV
ncbi:malonic semialdehyde reductase [Pseudorhodobacter sp. W20_MBD10_FR17]|uniref:malonic semialdehyde reductase n=1 Tax=Pseudorhodobacter sp. W20_MBD10_FR17 TaxID=3240266 RepID=UPI003F9C7FF6